MKYANTLFLFAIAASFFFQGCKKMEVAVPKTDQFSFSRHALEYVQLPLGKYLIYKDSASGQLDSVVVTTSNLENLYVPSYGGSPSALWLDFYSAYYHDVFHLILSKYIGNQSSNWFIGNGDAHYDHGGNLFASYGTPGDTLAVDLRNQDGFDVFYSFNSEYSNLSMNIEGKTYSNIIVTYSGTYFLNPSDPGYQVFVTYWAKPVGIIKRTMRNANSIKTYTLLRNN